MSNNFVETNGSSDSLYHYIFELKNISGLMNISGLKNIPGFQLDS